MSVPAYPGYRDSGVEWLGEVPSHWSVVQTKREFRKRKVTNTGMLCEDRLALTMNGVVPRALDDLDGLQSSDYEGYQIFEAGDLAFKLIDLQNVKTSRVGMVPSRGIMSPAYIRLEPANPDIGRFGFWYFMALYWTQVFNNLGGGVRQTLGPEDLLTVPFPRPPRDERIAIAAFLDRETGKIDALIDEQRRLIALLKEKRQAVISRAVTKGLDPHVTMKDSGVDWLGEVPVHWEVAPLKRFVQLATSGPRGWSDLLGSKGGIFFQSQNIGTDMRVLLDGAARIVPPAGPDTDRSSLQIDDVVVCITGGRTGAVAFVDHLPDEAFVNQHVCLIRPNTRHASGHFMSFVLFSEVGQKQLALAMYGLKQGLSLGDIRNLTVAMPTLAEQVEIAKVLASQFDNFTALEAEALKAIALLSERRAALISAAVTGKIDVCETGKVLPFPIDRTRARGLVATEIIERSAHQPTFGRVKFQKIAFLAEGHVGISELAGSYTREAAGPLDRALIDEMQDGARTIAGIEFEQPEGQGTTVTYRLTQPRGAHRQELADWLGNDRTAKLEKLIADFADINTKGAEAVATLYGVWNDALMDGASPTDGEIVTGFLNDWHPEKREKFRADELQVWLDWMRRHGVVPTGAGPKTTTGRLFV